MEEEKGISLVAITIGVIAIAILVFISVFMICDNGLIDQVENENQEKSSSNVQQDLSPELAKEGYNNNSANKALDFLYIATSGDYITKEDLAKVVDFLDAEISPDQESETCEVYEANNYTIRAIKDETGNYSKVEIDANLTQPECGYVEVADGNQKYIIYAN